MLLFELLQREPANFLKLKYELKELSLTSTNVAKSERQLSQKKT
jgi:hypothetical protein